MTARVTGTGMAGRSPLPRSLPIGDTKELGRTFQRALQRFTGQADRTNSDKPVKASQQPTQQHVPATLQPAPPPLERRAKPSSTVPVIAPPVAMIAPASSQSKQAAPISAAKDREPAAPANILTPPPFPQQRAAAAPELPTVAPQDAEFAAQLSRLDAALPASARTDLHLPGDQFAVRHVTVEQAQTGLSLTMDMQGDQQGEDALDDLLKRLRARGITAQIAIRDDPDEGDPV